MLREREKKTIFKQKCVSSYFVATCILIYYTIFVIATNGLFELGIFKMILVTSLHSLIEPCQVMRTELPVPPPAVLDPPLEVLEPPNEPLAPLQTSAAHFSPNNTFLLHVEEEKKSCLI